MHSNRVSLLKQQGGISSAAAICAHASLQYISQRGGSLPSLTSHCTFL